MHEGSPALSISPKRAGALALSAAAAATAVWIEAQSRRAEQDNPPMGKFVYIDGVRLHYVIRGEGPPVVLLHGNTVTHADFYASGLMDRLALNHQVIAFDRPGFGHSDRSRNRMWTPAAQAALLQRAVRALGIGPAVVLGHSMGTMVALALALDFPASVSSLVLVSGYYYPSVRMDAILTAPAALPVLGDVMRYTVTGLSARMLLNRAVKAMFEPNDVPPEFHASVARELMLRPIQLRANAEDAAFMMSQARSLSRRYYELHLPVTLFAGAHDKVVDVDAHTRRLHAELRQSELLVIPNTGHMVHYMAQDSIVKAVAKPVLRSSANEALRIVDIVRAAG
jgi:pimeloyl-ACP methyl ester carboxylesterase